MKGFTLLEVILTLILFTVSFVALSQSLAEALSVSGSSESSLIAAHLAQEKMEELKNKSYSSIASETKAPVSGFSPFQREVVVSTPQTNLKRVDVNVYWYHKADELKVSLATYLSNP